MDALTDRQLEVLRALIADSAARPGGATLRSIGDTVGISSTNGVTDHLKALARKGFVACAENIAWVPIRDPEGRRIRLAWIVDE